MVAKRRKKQKIQVDSSQSQSQSQLPSSPQPQPQSQYPVFPWIVLLCLCLGYFSLACLRKSLSISIPFMMETLEITKTDFGFMSSSFAATFGVSKFVGSLASDHISSKYLLCASLLLSALSTLLFCFTTSTTVFVLSWAVHGFGQGAGWPPISQLIFTYFEAGTRGTAWSIITSIGNVGYLVVPVLITPFLRTHGWKFSFFTLGVFGVVVVLILFLFLPKPLQIKSESANTTNKSLQLQSSHLSPWYLNGKVICLTLANALTALLLSAYTDWAGLYLREFYHLPEDDVIKIQFFGELGGLAAALLCGITADTYFQGSLDLFCLLFSLCLPLSLLTFPAINSTNSVSLPIFSLAFFFVVAAINGPKTLIGIAIRELVPSHSAGIASGVVGVVGQLGSTLAGSGIAFCLQLFGWNSYQFLLFFCSSVAIVLYLISYTLCPPPSTHSSTVSSVR